MMNIRKNISKAQQCYAIRQHIDVQHIDKGKREESRLSASVYYNLSLMIEMQD